MRLWQVDATVKGKLPGIEIVATDGTFLVQRAPRETRPVRWLLQTPERRAADDRHAPCLPSLRCPRFLTGMPLAPKVATNSGSEHRHHEEG
jgi:hypothetical protein